MLLKDWDETQRNWANPGARGEKLRFFDFPAYHLMGLAGLAKQGMVHKYLEPWGLSMPEWRLLSTVAECSPIRFSRIAQLTAKCRADSVDARDEIIGQEVQHGVCSDGRGRVSAERAVVRFRGFEIAAVRGFKQIAPRHHGGYRHQAASKMLCQKDCIRTARPVFARQKSSGAAKSGLDFIGDQQNAMLFRERTERVNIRLR